MSSFGKGVSDKPALLIEASPAITQALYWTSLKWHQMSNFHLGLSGDRQDDCFMRAVLEDIGAPDIKYSEAKKKKLVYYSSLSCKVAEQPK